MKSPRFVAVVLIFLAGAMSVLAQEESAGRMVTKDDWLAFMPLFIGCIIVVIVVDAFFILPIFHKNDEKKKDNQA